MPRDIQNRLQSPESPSTKRIAVCWKPSLEPHCRSSIAFPLLAAILFLFFVSASVPSPLFVVFQGRWGFSPGMLTVAFSIYSLVLLVTLLVAGSLSDHLGRKPVIVAAPPARKALGSLLTSISPLAGLATGAFFTGALLGVTDKAEIWAFGLLGGLFCLGAAIVLLIPETASRRCSRPSSDRRLFPARCHRGCLPASGG